VSREIDRDNGSHPPAVSRRDFLKIAAAAGLLAGCSPTQKPEAGPTSPPTILSTSAPTATPAPTGTPGPMPSGPSKVVRVHSGVWDGDTLAPDPIRQMLDNSITELTDIDDAGAAWASLFDPGERVAIKVNTIQSSHYWTHVPLVMAVTESLQDVGIPAEQIVIFFRSTGEVRHALPQAGRFWTPTSCSATSF
jgi:hypothetical protein